MAIHDNNVVESRSGFAKEIDAAGLAMVLDNLQVNQYQYPEKSTVREIASNAVDAVREKGIAIEILTGKAKVSDYYLERDEEIFKSSNFDETYFDLNWLDRNRNEVEIIYEEGDQVNKRDQLRIIDYGVGLGGKRLEGYFKLSWSSKRNSKDALGKFGIGAKSPLSTGVESYRMISRYNGKRFMFDIYSHKVDSAIGKFNANGEKNDSYVFENGFVAYYETTNEKNGTEIIIQTKKHHRQKYTDAVKSQLGYFKNVKYTIHREGGYIDSQRVLATVMYEDDHIILSDDSQFSKPHLVIGRHDSKVNYGYIDFLELELENKVGNIGIKVFSEDVAINPSRESVIWNEVTRKTVVDKFNTVVDIASNLVSKELNEKDFLKWLSKCQSVLHNTSPNTVLGRLSRIVDKEAISPAYPGNDKIKYGPINQLFWGFDIRKVSKTNNWDSKKREYVDKINRTEAVTWGDFNPNRVYTIKGSASPMKDAYILSLSNVPFTLIKVREEAEIETGKLTIAMKDQLKNKKPMVEKALLASSEIQNYDDLEIPEGWVKAYKKVEEEGGNAEAIKAPVLSPAEKRELEARTVLSKLVYDSYRNDDKLFRREKYEPKVGDIAEWTGDVIYGFTEDEELLHLAALILRNQGKIDTFNADHKVILVNKAIKKYFKIHTHVKEFFLQVQGGTVTMNDVLVKWNTGRLISEKLRQVSFLANFATFNDEMAGAFKKLATYVRTNYVDLTKPFSNNKFGCNAVAFQTLTAQYDRLLEMQQFVDKHQGEEDADVKIAEKAKALFNNDKVDNAKAVDLDVYKELTTVLEYSDSIKGLLNYIPVLQAEGENISYELESEIKAYLAMRGV